jgi:hypothetical protein
MSLSGGCSPACRSLTSRGGTPHDHRVRDLASRCRRATHTLNDRQTHPGAENPSHIPESGRFAARAAPDTPIPIPNPARSCA